MKQVIKKVIILFLYFSGISWIASKFQKNKVFCIGYHSIWDEINREELLHKLYKNISVNSKDFERQLSFLKKSGHTFIHFSDLKKEEIKKLNKPTVVFFDDGFKDVIKNAMPILKKHNIPATIFITTGLINQTHFLWTLGVRSFLLKQGQSDKFIENKIGELKKLGIIDRETEISKLFNRGNFTLSPTDFNIFLSWEDIKTLSQSSFEIGSHGIKHQKLTELSSAELKEELVGSKKILEDKIGTVIRTISYPYGRHNSTIIEAVRASGYSFGVSTLEGVNSLDYVQNHPFELKRLNPEEDETIQEFIVRLYTGI